MKNPVEIINNVAAKYSHVSPDIFSFLGNEYRSNFVVVNAPVYLPRGFD